jgi:hypothetical protein
MRLKPGDFKLTAKSLKPATNLTRFESETEQGRAMEVTANAATYFGHARVAVQMDVYDRFIAWPSEAIRKHGLYLEESNRLNAVLRCASIFAKDESGAEFTVRAMDSQGSDVLLKHVALKLVPDAAQGKTAWLIVT